MLNNLETLSNLRGISGNEKLVRETIISMIKDYATNFSVDNLGNLIVFKKGKEKPKNKVLFSAHMDEVGFIVTSVCDDGLLTFDCVGGLQSGTVLGKRVIVGNNIKGVIGAKAIHLLKEDERKTVQKFSDMRIDIGATSQEDALNMIMLGDEVTFDTKFEKFGSNKIISKAIDDRAGCAFMVYLIQQNLEYDCYFSFTVQEETGCVGAKTVAYAVKPDISVAIESTASADLPNVPSEKTVCKQKLGPVISFMDRGSIYDKELYIDILNWAKENNIQCQPKQATTGGNESRSLQVCGGGSKICAVSLPARYIHSGSNVVDIEDIESTKELLVLLTKKLPTKQL